MFSVNHINCRVSKYFVLLNVILTREKYIACRCAVCEQFKPLACDWWHAAIFSSPQKYFIPFDPIIITPSHKQPATPTPHATIILIYSVGIRNWHEYEMCYMHVTWIQLYCCNRYTFSVYSSNVNEFQYFSSNVWTLCTFVVRCMKNEYVFFTLLKHDRFVDTIDSLWLRK